MGWTYFGSLNKKTAIAKWAKDNNPLEYSVRGNVVYSIQQTHDGSQYIGITLFKKERGWNNWGYKMMHESEGPLYYDCPKKFFAKVSCVSEGSRNYRETCYRYAFSKVS